MSPKRILFVDDEVAVLEGLRNVLRKDRARWDMVFAAGAEQALAELARAPVDVVVTDMRMPGMDGAALLARVKHQYPAAARIVLSGHAERDAVLRALPYAHQFLNKPCDTDTLRRAIDRTCDLHRLLASASIRAVAGVLERLPSLPRIYRALTEAASDPRSSIAAIGKIVVSDPAMSAKVLQLVNSAYFGAARRVVSIHQAVACLGLELLKGLAIHSHVFDMMGHAAIEGFSLDAVQRDAAATARLARRFLEGTKDAEEAFAAALVCDVGKVVLAVGLPDQFRAALREARATGRPFRVVEQELFGVTHAEVGAYLLGVWGLPFTIVETVAFHHRPSAITEGPCAVLAAVHVADSLIGGAHDAEAGPASDAGLDYPFLERAGVLGELDRWRALASVEAAAPSSSGRA